MNTSNNFTHLFVQPSQENTLNMAQSFHSSNQTQNSIWVLFSLQIKRSVANTWSSQISRRRVYFHELKMFKASKNNVGTWNSCYRLKLRLLWIVKIKIRRFPYSRWGLRFCWSLRCPTESHDGRMSQTGSAAFNYNRHKAQLWTSIAIKYGMGSLVSYLRIIQVESGKINNGCIGWRTLYYAIEGVQVSR